MPTFSFPTVEIPFVGILLPVCVVIILILMGAVQGACAYLTLLERKIAAWTQDRIGPNRVGPFGLLQPLADGVKFLFKEQIVPKHVDKLFYFLGPMIAVSTATFAIAAVPFGSTMSAPVLMDHRVQPAVMAWPQTRAEEAEILAADKAHAAQVARGIASKPADEVTLKERAEAVAYPERVAAYNEVSLQNSQYILAPRLDIGMVFIFAIGSLAAYGIILGGWSSNNKYSFLASLRASAQLISYEIPMGMSVVTVLLLAGSLNMERIIDFQIDNGWNVIAQPLMALVFIVAVYAECNRVPFDLSECEQELVGGFHTEYSGMKFALYALGEYTHMISTSFLAMSLFFGGWYIPYLVTPESSWWLKLGAFSTKMLVFIVGFMLIRWTIPRFRFDQLMGLAWKVLLPMTVLSLLSVVAVRYFDPAGESWLLHRWILGAVSIAILIGMALFGLQQPLQAERTKLNVTGHGTPYPVAKKPTTTANS